MRPDRSDWALHKIDLHLLEYTHILHELKVEVFELTWLQNVNIWIASKVLVLNNLNYTDQLTLERAYAVDP